jgi:hypothetical protein
MVGSMRHLRLKRWLDWVRDLPILAGLWGLDRIAGPMPETEADQIREREEEAKVVPLRARR